jgi:hypothetical protein
MPKPRNYRREYDTYHGKEEQIQRRAARVKARRYMEKNGRARRGDGKDVDHRDSDPMNNSPSNLKLRDRSANRRDNT